MWRKQNLIAVGRGGGYSMDCSYLPHFSHGLLGGRYWQGHVMTCRDPRHSAFISPFLHKKILKIIFYDRIGIEMNIMQAGLYVFFLLILKKLKQCCRP